MVGGWVMFPGWVIFPVLKGSDILLPEQEGLVPQLTGVTVAFNCTKSPWHITKGVPEATTGITHWENGVWVDNKINITAL